MRHKGLTNKDIAELLHISPKTVRQKINQTTDFTRSETFEIKKLFPEKTYEYLFSDITVKYGGC